MQRITKLELDLVKTNKSKVIQAEQKKKIKKITK